MPEPSEANRAKGKYWDFPWGLVESCDKVSEGCRDCWLLGMRTRFHQTGPVRFRADRLDVPLRRRKGAVFAVWSDLFHGCVSQTDRDRAFDVMQCNSRHTFIVLTKRNFRGVGDYGHSKVRENVILGVTAENQARLEGRLPDLLATPAATRMLSVEPMLGPMDFDAVFKCLELGDGELRHAVHWLVLGCESGPKRRPTPWAWLESAVEQCVVAGVAVWVKQIAANPDGTGKVLHDMAAFPPWARRREWPLGKENPK